MIETWAFYFFIGSTSRERELSPAEFQEAFDRYVALWRECEGWGFDGLTWAEHHFNPMHLLPSPHLIVAAVAAMTTKLRLSTLGAVLPLYDARRYVEELGMLDYLTRGRFEPGIAAGAGDVEGVLAGIPSEDLRPRYYSAAEVIAKAVEEARVTHHDAFSNLEQVPMIPRMRQETGRSLWVTVMSPSSAAWTAERGYKMCTAWLPTAGASALATTYREAAESAGIAVTPQMLGLRRRVFVADTDAEAEEKHEAAVDLVEASLGGFETADPAIRKVMSDPDDFAIGAPESVAEKLIEQCRAGGYGTLFAFTDFSSFDHKDLCRSHELIGRRVAPLLRSASLASDLAGTSSASGESLVGQ